MANWYCDSVAYTAVAQWAALTHYAAGAIVRQVSPSVGNERCFITAAGGISAASEPTWVLTQGSSSPSDGTVTDWKETTGLQANMGTTWACPHARLSNAIASGWAAAGDTVFIASESADTRNASMTLTSHGTSASPIKIICVTKTSNALPPAQADITTGSSTNTTGGNQLTLTSSIDYYYGVNFSVAGSANLNICGSTFTAKTVADNCAFTVANGLLVFGPNGTTTSEAISARLSNVTVNFSNIACQMVCRSGNFEWFGGSLTGTVPTQLIGNANAQASQIDIRDVDLNSAGTWTSKFLVNLSSIGGGPTRIKFTNCKLATTLGAITTGTISARGMVEVDLIVTDSTSNVIVREEHYRYEGSMVQDTTNYRNGGASDGTTNNSWKVVTLAGASYTFPFDGCPDILVPVYTTGTYTFTMYIGSGGTLNTNDVGFRIEYMGSSASPLGTYTDTLPGLLASNVAITTDSVSTWSGASATTLQKVSITVTLNAKGVVRIRPIVCKASATVWIDPDIGTGGTNGQRQFSLIDAFMNEEASSGGGGGMIVHPGLGGGARG